MQKLLLTITLCWLTAPLYAASFDCAKASTFVEKTICSNPDLSALDDSLNEVYRKLISPSRCADYQIPFLKEAQKSWLAETRNPCKNVSCLSKAYSERINEINADITKPSAVAAKDSLTGSYQTRCIGIAGLGGGILKIKELPGEQLQFVLDCNRGAPSYNMGIMEGIISRQQTGKARYIAPKEDSGDGSCEMAFDFSKLGKVSVKQNGDPFACGFGNGVMCDGDYEIFDGKTPDMSITP